MRVRGGELGAGIADGEVEAGGGGEGGEEGECEALDVGGG